MLYCALAALACSVGRILVTFVGALFRIAVLGVMLLLIDVLARPIQLTLDSRPLLRREIAAGLARASLVQFDLRFLPSKPCRLDTCQLTAANALSNPLLLIVLAFVDAIPPSLRQAGRRDYDCHQRRHHKPFHEPLHFHYLLPPWPAAPCGGLKVNML